LMTELQSQEARAVMMCVFSHWVLDLLVHPRDLPLMMWGKVRNRRVNVAVSFAYRGLPSNRSLTFYSCCDF
jgi:hypothetical protein